MGSSRSNRKVEAQSSRLFYSLLLGFFIVLFRCQKYRCVLRVLQSGGTFSLVFVARLSRP